MLKQKLVDITPGSVADFLIRLAVLVLLHFWLLNARDTITETGLQSMGERRHSYCQAGEQEDMSQSILIETVRVVRDFLQIEVDKFEIWEEAKKSLELKRLFGDVKNPLASYSQVKSKGIGEPTITKFLGGGWKQWKIQSALDTLNAADINLDAII